MLTAQGSRARRDRLWRALPAECNLLIVGDPSHLTYLAAFAPSPFVFRTVESGAVLVLEPARATLVADDMLGPFLDRAFVDEVVAPCWYDGNHSAPHRRRQLVQTTLDRLAGVPGKRIGVELSSVPAGVIEGLRSARPGLEIVDIAPIIRTLRRAKDPDEVEVLFRSMRAGEKGQAAALEQIKPGMTELDAYRIVQNAAMMELGEPAILYGDFASGPRCEIEKGGPPTSRRIEAGDLLLLDFSVVVSGYRGDFTNTFAVGRGPTRRQQELFEACLGALEAGEASLKAGTPGRAVDAAVRGYFASLKLAGAFSSHSGHGLGLGHPEPPYFVPNSDDTLEIGDVVALEPGLYIEGEGGMRYERNYLITESGFRTLSHHQISIVQSAR
jgi:Xaa-Pro aminopeptidase